MVDTRKSEVDLKKEEHPCLDADDCIRLGGNLADDGRFLHVGDLVKMKRTKKGNDKRNFWIDCQKKFLFFRHKTTFKKLENAINLNSIVWLDTLTKNQCEIHTVENKWISLKCKTGAAYNSIKSAIQQHSPLESICYAFPKRTPDDIEKTSQTERLFGI